MKISVLMERFCDLNNYKFTDDYSGRFMYGETCVGIVCENPCKVMLKLGLFLHAYGVDENTEFSVRMDNMGKDSMIVYFPGLRYGE